MYDSAFLCVNCPTCKNEIKINNVWTPGGVNDYGGWVVECNNCSTKSHVRIGRDVRVSEMISGAKLIDQYDDELGNKEEILSKYGLKDHDTDY